VLRKRIQNLEVRVRREAADLLVRVWAGLLRCCSQPAWSVGPRRVQPHKLREAEPTLDDSELERDRVIDAF